MPRAFIAAWFPDFEIVLSDKGATAIALAHLVYSTVLTRLWYLREDKKREQRAREQSDDPQHKENVQYLRPLG